MDGWAVGNTGSLSGNLNLAGVRGIGEYIFSSTELTSVTIPSSVVSIGSGAFMDCSDLTNVTISDQVTNIEIMAFFGCDFITSVTITANGGNAASVKQAMMDAGVSENITWNMPS